MNHLIEDIYTLRNRVRSYANEISHSMSKAEQEQVLDLLEQIDNLEEMIEEFDDMISDVWERAETF